MLCINDILVYLQHLRRLLWLLHERDSRRSFCPKDHWVAKLPYHQLDQVRVAMYLAIDDLLFLSTASNSHI